MSIPLLKTKLHIPASQANFVSRQDLFTQLEAGLGGRMTLVAAPAGFGKTTLISNWAHHTKWPVAWVSLAETDNDPTLFWAYLVSGLQSAHPDGGDDFWGQINITQLPPIKTLLAQLINTLAEWDGRLLLILDDYHVISNSQIHQDLAYLIDNQPPALHILILTRADPPLSIARLRGRGLLAEIRTNDLRFTVEETEVFLNGQMRLSLNDQDIETLDQRTEGWIIGLQLAAISMQRQTDKGRFIRDFSGSHHFILEYLTEEVIDQLPASTQRFLLQSAVLDQFNAALCDEIVRCEDSAAQLEELQRHNLFIIPLDDEHIWFRYHHLFRDLLKNRLRREFMSEHIAGLYQSASQWYLGENDLAEAVKYALLAEDFALAADLIEQAASGTMLHGHLVTLHHWIEALPASLLESRPRLNFYRAWALSLGGQPKVAEQILLDIKSTLDTLPETPENQSLRGELAALLTGIIVYTNDPPRILREAQEALTYLSAENLISRARVYIAMSTAYAYSDQIEAAIQTYQQARDLALEAGNPFLAVAAIEMLAGMQIFHLGALREAAANLEQALALGEKQDGPHQTFTGTAKILLAEIQIERNQLELAAKTLAEGTRLIETGGIGYSQTYVYCTQARLYLAQGEHQEAIETLALAKQTALDCPLMHTSIHNLACQVKFALCLGDIETAAEWIAPKPDSAIAIPENLPTYLQEVQQIAHARVYLAQNNFSAAFETLGRVHPQAASAGRTAHLIEILLLKASGYQKQKKRAPAMEALKQAISYAAPAGYQRIFLEGGQPIKELLQFAAYQNFQPKFLNPLLAAFNGQAVQSGPLIQGTVQPPHDALVETLSERECEVLKLIAAGYTNQQIADALVVSLNTVKKHSTHIYGKLGVQNRTEAANRAREFGLT